MILTSRWVLPIKSKPLENGALLIKGDKIQAVSTKEELLKRYSSEEVIDFGQAALLPGFVDAHTHLEYSVFRGVCDDLDFSSWKIQVVKKERKLDANSWLTSARLGALEAISSGITCVADITKRDAALAAIKETGLRGVIFYEVSEMDNSKIGAKVEETKKTILEWQEKSGDKLVKIGVSPYSSYNVAPPLIKEISLLAQRLNLLMCLHVAGSKDEWEFVKYGSGELATTYRELMGWKDILWQPMGVTPVKYLEQWDAFEGEVVAVHCVHVTDWDIDILKKYNVSIVHCPKCSAKLGMGIAPLGEFIRRGFKIGLGTDSPASNNTMDMLDEMRTGLLLQRGKEAEASGFSAELFVKMATIGGASVLRLDKEIGSLEEGKQADVIAIDLSKSHQVPVSDPYSALVYTANQDDVIFTMVAGKVLYDRGKFTAMEEDKILSKVEPIRVKLMNF